MACTNLLLHIGAALLIWDILRRLAIPGALPRGAAVRRAPGQRRIGGVDLAAQERAGDAVLPRVDPLRTCGPRRGCDRSPVVSPGVTERWYWLSLAAFVLAMLSKGSVAVLPALLLGDRLVAASAGRARSRAHRAVLSRRRRAGARQRVVPDARRAHRRPEAPASSSARSAPRAVVWFYLYKAILPIDLAFIYPQLEHPGCDQVLWWLPLSAAAATTPCAVVVSRGLGPTAAVRLGVLLRVVGAGDGLHRRGLHGALAGRGSLPAPRDHRRGGTGGGRLGHLAAAGARIVPLGAEYRGGRVGIRARRPHVAAERSLRRRHDVLSSHAEVEPRLLARTRQPGRPAGRMPAGCRRRSSTTSVRSNSARLPDAHNNLCNALPAPGGCRTRSRTARKPCGSSPPISRHTTTSGAPWPIPGSFRRGSDISRRRCASSRTIRMPGRTWRWRRPYSETRRRGSDAPGTHRAIERGINGEARKH